MINFLNQLSDRYSNAAGANRVAINTIILYAQRLTTAALAFVITPIILNALGVEDYGIYTLTMGFVGMLAFVNWSLSSATQRYIAFALGAGDVNRLKKIFATSAYIHFAYGVLIFLIMVFFGGFIVDTWLKIPPERVAITKIVIRFISAIIFFNIIKVPLIGVFRAHENFLFLAFIGIAESIMKLIIAVALLHMNYDRLFVYSLLLCISSILLYAVNLLNGKWRYTEVNFSLKMFDRELAREMLNFMSWSLLGALAVLSRNQAVSVILNIFFGVVKNAAYGIAMQVNFAVGILGQGIIGSMSPKIVKSAGSGDIEKMTYLMRTMSKFAVLSISLVAIPFCFEAPIILRLWLKIVPEETVIYSRLVVSFALLTGLSAGIQNVFEAIGKVKLYNIWVSLILILNIPISYVLFKLGFPSYSIIVVGMSLEIVSFGVRLLLLKKYVKYSILSFMNDVVLKIFIPISLIGGIIILIKMASYQERLELLLAMLTTLFIFPLIVYAVSFDKRQKVFINNKLGLMKRKIISR